MAWQPSDLKINVKIKFDLSLWQVIKLRIAGESVRFLVDKMIEEFEGKLNK